MKLQEGKIIISHSDLTPRIIAQVVGEEAWLCLKHYYGVGTPSLPSRVIANKLGVVQNTVVRRARRGLTQLHNYLYALHKLSNYVNGQK